MNLTKGIYLFPKIAVIVLGAFFIYATYFLPHIKHSEIFKWELWNIIRGDR
ncbi:MAG: hypothetical protein J7J09_08720 [Kosmotoga sp.]|nr:hypothetical protein [Kosmotoga sp.]